MEKQLAKIRSGHTTMLRETFLSFWIGVDYESGGSQNLGGIVLDDYNEQLKRRVGTAAGCELIRRILKAFEVDDLNDLKGRACWVYGEGKGFDFMPKGIQSLKVDPGNDEPVIFSEIFEDPVFYKDIYDAE